MVTDEMIDRVHDAIRRAPTEAEIERDRASIREVLEALDAPSGRAGDRREAATTMHDCRDKALNSGGVIGTLPLSAQSRFRMAVLDELWPSP
jgi:hypothetical protein